MTFGYDNISLMFLIFALKMSQAFTQKIIFFYFTILYLGCGKEITPIKYKFIQKIKQKEVDKNPFKWISIIVSKV